MVDPTQGTNQYQNIVKTSRAQAVDAENDSEESQEAEKVSALAPQDEVVISQEALSLSQAEETAAQVRQTLEENSDESLGLDPDFDTES